MSTYWQQILLNLSIQKKILGASKFEDQKLTSGPLKSCVGPQNFNVDGPRPKGPWYFWLICTPETDISRSTLFTTICLQHKKLRVFYRVSKNSPALFEAPLSPTTVLWHETENIFRKERLIKLFDTEFKQHSSFGMRMRAIITPQTDFVTVCAFFSKLLTSKICFL